MVNVYPLNFSQLMKFNAPSSRLFGVTPNDRIMPRRTSVRMPQTGHNGIPGRSVHSKMGHHLCYFIVEHQPGANTQVLINLGSPAQVAYPGIAVRKRELPPPLKHDVQIQLIG